MNTTTPFQEALLQARVALSDGRDLVVTARSACASIDAENRWVSAAGRRFAAEMAELDTAASHALARIDAWADELVSAEWQAGACG